MFSSRAYLSSNWRDRDQNHSHGRWQQRNFREKQRREKRERTSRYDVKREVVEATRVYVGNMPYIAQASDVEQFFTEAGFEIVNIDFSIDSFTNRNPSFCFVDLATPDEATAAMQTLSGKFLLGRPLKVRSCVQKNKDRGTLQPTPASSISTRWHKVSCSAQQSEVITAAEGSTGQHSPGLDLLLPIREGRRLYVGGLPKPLDQHSSDLELCELFKDFSVQAVSKVKSPSKAKLANGGNLWYAFVDLSTAEEAESAMTQLDGTEKWGGELSVHLATGVPEKVFERTIWESEQMLLETIRGTSSSEDGL